jgi:hypothetical protein
MKRLFTIMTAILLTASVFAQSPQKMSYQAVIRNSLDQLVTNHAVGMQISILQGSSSGTVVYTETQTPTTNANGLVSIEIGGGAGFDAINWANYTFFIKTETDPLGGTTYTITGTSQLLSVPYALYAKTAGGHYVGELYGGGIVVAVWKVSGVEHGLIASLLDLSPGIIWTTASYQSTTVPGGALSPINGLSNSNAIVAQAGAGTTYAAGLCRAYTAIGDGGLVDWYLPAAWELNQCYNAAFVVNTILGATNGFKMAYYFSSTENGSTGAETQEFVINGYTGVGNKDNPIRVRAVRRF